MKLVLSLAVLALIGDTQAVQKHYHRHHSLSQTRDGEETMKEQEERELELKKAQNEVKEWQNFNEFDGLYHVNGERYERNGHKIYGVNEYAQKRSRQDDDHDDTIAEGQQRSSEVAAAGQQAVANENKRQVDAKNAAIKAYWDGRVANAHGHFDGNVHEPDGSLGHVDGTKVEGANAGIAYHQRSQLPKRGVGYRLQQLRDVTADEDNFSEKQDKENELQVAHLQAEFNRKYNQFDGLVHDDDGQTKFLDGRVVGGVNNLNSFMQTKSRAFGVDVADRNIVQDDINREKRKQLRAKAIARNPFNHGIYNEFDGLIHTITGQRIDPETGKYVDQEDLQIKKDNFDFDADLKLRLQAAEDSPDGLIHNEDGTTIDPVSGQQVLQSLRQKEVNSE